MGGFFQADEVFGAENALELGAAEVGDREDFLNLEAGLAENHFHIFGVVIIEAVGVEVLEAGGFQREGVDVGFFGPVTEHFGQSALVSDLNHRYTTGAKDAIELIGNFLHIGEVMGGAHHHQSIKGVILEGQRIDVAGLGLEAVTVDFAGLGELGFGVVKEGGGGGAREVFVGEAPVAAGNIHEGFHMLGQELADGEAVSQVLVFAVGVFPEDFFVIVAVVVGDDFGGCGGRRGGLGRFGRFSGGFIRGLRWFGRGLFASCHRYHYNIKAKKREPWGEALLGEKGLLEESSLWRFLWGLVSRERLELSTPGLKGPCSNQLSYRPTRGGCRQSRVVVA